MEPPVKPTFKEAFRFWLKLGFISFGGPAGQIAIMHEEVVERKKWVSEEQFLHGLNFCMLLPGPEAQQLATYLGWRLHRTWGGIAAGALFVLPSAVLLWLLAWIYMEWGDVQWVSAVFSGLLPAVLAIIVAAAWRIGKKVLKNRVLWILAAAAFVALFVFKLPFVLVVLGAGLAGWLGGRWKPGQLVALGGHGGADVGQEDGAFFQRGDWIRMLRVTATGLALWWLPVLAVGLGFGFGSIFFQQGIFFSKAALLTFGGAYAVLPYVAQQAVGHFQWLSMEQMMSGLALAETTPGPLVMVLQFVGFIGAWQRPGNLAPLAAGTLGAAVTTWTTFLPSFVFIFLGAPSIERLQKVPRLGAALSAITAAVVGVIANLAVWFGWEMAQGEAVWNLPLAVIFFCLLHFWKWPVPALLVLAAVWGLGFHLATV
jgi:chromate transporter